MRKYNVALSFAGEDREHARKLAKLLKANEYSVFYDENERARLWSDNLYDCLSSIYKDEADYCVMFLSEHYAREPWTNLERKSAQARVFEGDSEYILSVRLDDAEIPGILPTDGYLDLREWSIEEVYQVLVEKLSGTPSQSTAIYTPTSPESEGHTGDFALFRSEDGQLYFIPFQDARWDSAEISLALIPESSEQSAFLRSLRVGLSSTFARHGFFSLALGDDAAWVSLKNLVQTTSGTQTIWNVLLEEIVQGSDQDPFEGVTFANFTPDQIAEIRARRILLNQSLPNPDSSFNPIDQKTLEVMVSRESSAHHVNSIHVVSSPLPELYRSCEQTAERFQKFARLVSVLYLKLSNTVEHVLQLDLELLTPEQLHVKFQGRRRQSFFGEDPSVIEVNGICPL